VIGWLWWVIIATLLIAGVALEQGVLLLFGLLLALGSAASVLWARYCLAGVGYARRLGATRLNFGEETELTVEVVNAKPLPLAWLRARDEWPEEVTLLTGTVAPSYKEERQILENWLAMRWYERVRRVYRLRGAQRGAFTFGPAQLTAGDLFGFRSRTEELAGTEALLVYPRIIPVWEWHLPSGRPLGEALSLRRLIADPLRFAGTRDYIPGDNPRHIHWKNSARWRSLQTRLFDPEATQTVALVVDVQTSLLGTYWVVPAHLEMVITAAASIALYALGERLAVGLYTNSSAARLPGPVQVAAGRSPAQATLLMEAFARMRGFIFLSGEELLNRLARRLPWGASVVAITAQPTPGLQAALLAVQDAGHGARLLTVGNAPAVAPANLAWEHLGDENDWKDLSALALA
jgi:uncharacterized protein (DUF58 family)